MMKGRAKMSNDSGGDTGTSCLEHNFISDFESCPKCMMDVANHRADRLQRELAAVTSERDVLSKKLREVAIDYVDGHDQEALLQWLASIGGQR